MTRSTPAKLGGSESKSSSMKRDTCPDGGSVSVSGGAARVPSRPVTSRVTVLTASAALVIATPVRIEPACSGVPDDST